MGLWIDPTPPYDDIGSVSPTPRLVMEVVRLGLHLLFLNFGHQKGGPNFDLIYS